MKLALILFGLSYTEYNHWEKGKVIIDYQSSIDNYKEYIYKYFNNLGYDIDVYFATNTINDDKIKQKLLDTYKPVNYTFLENEKFIDGTRDFKWMQAIKPRNLKMKAAIECCLNSNINYDTCLITRFDLLFQKDFSKSNIKLDTLNLVSILERPTYICDNFYLFPYKLLNNIYKLVINNIDNSFHYIKNDFDKIANINFILNEYNYISNLNFYKIVRKYN
jgi:hypothetical protein